MFGIGSHALLDDAYQQITVVVTILETVIISIDDLFGHSQRIASTERLSEGYQLVDDAP